MRSYGTLLTLILAAGVGTVMAVPAAPAGDQAKIDKLIKQLGSDNFRQRDAANKELDAIGEPALEALRKAAKSSDMETANRAAALVTRIQHRAENTRLLAPTYVELSFKDKSVAEAVAELAKRSGFQVVLGGDTSKLADRKVTLETGKVPFWKALDLLCEKADLVEADGLVNPAVPIGVPVDGGPIPLPAPVPPVRIQPVPPVNIKPINIKPIQLKPVQIKPVPADKPAEKPAVERKPLPPEGFAVEVQAKEAPAKPAPAQPAQPVQVQVQVQIAPAVQPVPPPVGGGFRGRPQPGFPGPGQFGPTIVLVDGKAKPAPAHVEGAVRVRAITKPEVVANYGQAPEGQFGLVLETRPEPKVQVIQILGVKIDKAVDNYDQVLDQASTNELNGPIGFGGPVRGGPGMQPAIAIARPYPGYGYGFYGNNVLPLRLKKGEKEPKALKELRGVVSMKIQTPVDDLVTVENLLKAKGESVKGKGDAVVKVIDVTTAENGEVSVQVELQHSNEVQPQARQQQLLPPRGLLPPANGNIQIQIAPAAPPVAPLPPQGGPGGFAAPAVVFNYLGLDLVDAKGESLQLVKMQMTKQMWQGNGRTVTADMTFKPAKDQEAAKLVLKGTRYASVDVPFLLKDVPLK